MKCSKENIKKYLWGWNKIYLFLLLLGILFLIVYNLQNKKNNYSDNAEVKVKSPFIYDFESSDILYESGTAKESTSQYWWLNSGGILNIHDGYGETATSSLQTNNFWRKLYNKNNPTDTDNGYHPQNLFRLISRSLWQDVSVENYFMITSDQKSESTNRNESNGILLFLRYKDSNNLYYAGLRVDGTAVIKKKFKGEYFTLGQVALPNSGTYDRLTNLDQLPKNTWIGIKAEIRNISTTTVNIKLYSDLNNNGKWKVLLDVDDDGSAEKPITTSGYVGIRTDFMDVRFDNFKAEGF